MRLTALFLLLLPLFSCEEEATTRFLRNSDNATDCKPCEAATPDEADKICEVFNGECARYKKALINCCSQRTSCLAKFKETKEVPESEYTQCGKEQAGCIDGISFNYGVCDKHATSIKVHAVSKGRPGTDFMLRPKLGVTSELYGNCTAAAVKIDYCATELTKCEVSHDKRSETGGAVLEPYMCASVGTQCLETVLDIDRTLDCARELGYASEVMRRRWAAKVDGKEEGEEDSTSYANPFNTVIEAMQERWGLSWWGAWGIIVGSTAGLMAMLCCCCYCCAMMQITRQKAQRRWERKQDRKEQLERYERGVDRYSNVESARSSSVRASRYSREEEEE